MAHPAFIVTALREALADSEEASRAIDNGADPETALSRQRETLQAALDKIEEGK
jgi:hypothetical protein